MLTHYQIWSAIDALALRTDLSPSGLAKKAGLDPTTFNKSKRKTQDGKERWPSTESIAKILQATGTSLDEFLLLLTATHPEGPKYTQPLPLLDFSEASTSNGFFDEEGVPKGLGWDKVRFPEIHDKDAYALEVSGPYMSPFYRDGDILIISPNAEIRKNDKVIIKIKDQPLRAYSLERKTDTTVELMRLDIEKNKISYAIPDIIWMARILWASQ